MSMPIGVYLGDNNQTASFSNTGKLVIYQKTGGSWQTIKEKPFPVDKNAGISGLRRNINQAKEFLDDCKVFVGASIVGIGYFELEKAGFSVWEFTGAPDSFLDYVLEQEETAESEASPKAAMPEPAEVKPGYFEISLKDIQKGDAGFTSKQILQAFVRKGQFIELEVRCSHVPPWLQLEMTSGNMTGRMQKISPDEIMVVLKPKVCSH